MWFDVNISHWVAVIVNPRVIRHLYIMPTSKHCPELKQLIICFLSLRHVTNSWQQPCAFLKVRHTRQCLLAPALSQQGKARSRSFIRRRHCCRKRGWLIFDVAKSWWIFGLDEVTTRGMQKLDKISLAGQKQVVLSLHAMGSNPRQGGEKLINC